MANITGPLRMLMCQAHVKIFTIHMMINTKTTFLVFALLLLLTTPFSYLLVWFDGLAAIVPGWHTTVWSTSFFFTFFNWSGLLLSVVLYWRIRQRVKTIRLLYFVGHLMMTLPLLIVTKWPLHTLIDYDSGDVATRLHRLESLNTLHLFLYAFFVLGQLLFVRYYFSLMAKNPKPVSRDHSI